MRRQAEIRQGSDFGHVLAEARRGQGLTQAEMAEHVGLTRTYVSLMERGRSTPLMDHFIRALRRSGAHIVVTFDVSDKKPHADAQT